MPRLTMMAILLLVGTAVSRGDTPTDNMNRILSEIHAIDTHKNWQLVVYRIIGHGSGPISWSKPVTVRPQRDVPGVQPMSRAACDRAVAIGNDDALIAEMKIPNVVVVWRCEPSPDQ
jgi:hypothetical protein